jgi:hypothetical protein
VPLGIWVRLELLLDQAEAGMAAAAPRSFRLAVTVPGQPEKVFDALPYMDVQFRELHWFGFCAADRPGGVYYVDNLRLEAALP